MADSGRNTQAGLKERLPEFWEAPTAYDFFHALRLVESHFPEYPRLGTSVKPGDDPVRLGQEPSLGFAPASLAGAAHSRGGAPDRIDVLFFGLFGPNGPLPLHLTEYTRDRLRNEDDATLARFADLFHHRLLSLFYRAWSSSEPAVSHDRPDEDEFGERLASLSGYGAPGLKARDALPDVSKLYYGGLFSSQSKSAEGLRAIIADLFGLPVRIEPFIGHWIALEEQDRTRLDGDPDTAVLGVSALLGNKVWDCQHRIRIEIGPMDLAAYERFLPGDPTLGRLRALVRNYLDGTLEWELRPILKRDQIPPAVLGGPVRLGWSTWLTPETLTDDAGDLRLDAERQMYNLNEPGEYP
jgi:type VI secretion system protein ImpH